MMREVVILGTVWCWNK